MSTTQLKTVGFKPNERNIFFHILTACNLSCRHCYINPAQHGTTMVSRQTMDDWLRLFHDPDKESNVIFLGGEPTMHPDLAHGIKTARALGYQSITVDTNGFLFHDLLSRISPDDAVLSFSLDGPSAEVNDPIRGEGVFATCTENIKKAAAMGFSISLIYTVSKMNLEQLAQMPKLLAKLKVERFFIQVIGLRGKSVQHGNNLQLTPEEWLTAIPQTAENAAALGIDVTFPKVFLDKDEKFECAGNVADNYFIFPNGRVYRCPLCEDYPLNSMRIENNQLLTNEGLTEDKLFTLEIPEGCVMNKLLQPGNITYDDSGHPQHRISCCLLKQKISPISTNQKTL
ncbi:MAG: radical SAM protein [Proteobacteria bacterium]|nr:radical SAM protein [Pseudomonadota bacterium]MBU1716246.1 radical SAM protein [Pseudomonadota bacterium]